MDPPPVDTYAGTGSNRSADGPRLRANLGAPTGMFCQDDDVYICDYYGNTIRKMSLKTETMTTVAGDGNEKGAREGEALMTSLPTPRYVFPDGTGGWIVTCYVHAQVVKLKDGRLSVLAGASESGFVDGPREQSRFDYPRGGCVDPRTGSLYITDYGNHRVRIINSEGMVSSIGCGTKACKDGSATVAAFNGPLDLCTAPNNAFYVCELGAVRLVDGTSHEVTTFAGAETCGLLDGPRLAARFSGLTAVAWRNETIFLADFNNHLVRMISSTGMVSTFAGSTKGFSDGPALQAQFQFPWGLCLTPEGHLLISDSSNNRIRIMRNVVEPLVAPITDPLDNCSFLALQNLISAPSLPTSMQTTFVSDLNIHPALAALLYPELLLPSTLSALHDALISPSTSKEFSKLLYANVLPPDADLKDVVDIIHCCAKLGIAQEFLPMLLHHVSTAMPRLPVSVCMDILSHINKQCPEEQRLLDLAVASIQSRLQPGEVPAACQPLLATNSEFAVKIMTRLLKPESIQLPETINVYPGWLIRQKLEDLYWTCVDTTDPNRTCGSPLHPSLGCNFSIMTDDGTSLRVHDWVLYARWPYFQHLINSGFSESEQHQLELPSDTFSPELLKCFVRYLYTQDVEPFDSDTLKLQLLRVAPQFNLVDLSSPPVPHPHFKRLLMHCRVVLNAPCTLESCVSQYKLMAEMGSSQQLNAVGRFILDHFPTISQNPQQLKQLKELGTHAIGEMWLRSKSCDLAEWRS